VYRNPEKIPAMVHSFQANPEQGPAFLIEWRRKELLESVLDRNGFQNRVWEAEAGYVK
jgi:hypothetical protein